MFDVNAQSTTDVYVRSVFRVFIPPAVRPTLSRQMAMGYLTCAIWGRARQAQTAKELTRRDRKTVPHPAPPLSSVPPR